MKSPKNRCFKQPQKQAKNCRLPAACGPAYAPLTARLLMPFTLSCQEARCAVFYRAPGCGVHAAENAHFEPQNARSRARN